MRSIFSSNLQPNDHNVCLATSIVVGIDHATNHIDYLTINEAKTLCVDAGVNLQHGGGIDEVIKFQKDLDQDYRIVVYTSQCCSQPLQPVVAEQFYWGAQLKQNRVY